VLDLAGELPLRQARNSAWRYDAGGDLERD
jgi:hypothetical protein